DMFMLDLSGGPFASINLGEKLRAYGAIGPLMQFVNYEHESKDSDVFINESSTGFGLGWYSRLGIELAVSNALMVGLGARWVDSRVDLSDGLGDLDVKGSQVFLTFTTGF
ncbi:MAG: opacity protein-like surface antigen, partial [Planctomycetota bacterium]